MPESASSLAIVNARVVTPPSLGVRRGGAMSDVLVLPRAGVRVKDGLVVEVSADLAPRPGELVVDAASRVLVPGFVDCHTHACFAGDRLDEWEQRLAGTSYLDILRAGGGIMSSVRATRTAGQERLTRLLHQRLDRMLRLGSTTIEVKSGYALSTEGELAMLRAIARAAAQHEAWVVPTALLGHALDPDVERREFIERVVHETLAGVHAEFPGAAVDAFCENGAWTLDETLLLLRKALELGHPVRVHADQFNSLGMVEAAIELGARSVDHLEASTPQTLKKLADSPTIGVALPCCGVHMTGRGGAGGMFADLRTLVDLGGACAIATNLNPGSAPCYSIPAAMAASVRCCGLSWREAMTATTVNAAGVLGLFDRGAIVPGARADLLLLHHTDERSLCFEFGSNPVRSVMVNGRLLGQRGPHDDHAGL